MSDGTPTGRDHALDTAIDVLVSRLAVLPDGSVTAMTLFGPNDRTVTVRVSGGVAAIVAAREHQPAAVLSFHVDAAIDIAGEPAAAVRLAEAGRLHRRGNAVLADAAVEALSAEAARPPGR